ncbi:hypothetical protein NU195Hw_Modified_185t1 [Hortaea werneckii]
MESATSSDNTSSSATIASSRASSNPRRESLQVRQHVRRQHSFTHVFPAQAEQSSQRIPQKYSATSRAAVKELLNPTTSMDPDDRTKMLFHGLQWLLESSAPSNELDQRASGSPRPLSHDAVNEFNLDDKHRAASLFKNSKAGGAGSQSTEAWVDSQAKAKADNPW